MADSPESEADASGEEPDGPRAEGSDRPEPAGDEGASTEPDSLRERVEAEFDAEGFSPADMAELSVEEWEAAFDADTWITGPELLERVERDLRSRVASRDVFAVVERVEHDGTDHVLAYNEAGYALVSPEGTVEGEGALLRDVEPVVALCSMADYDVGESPADGGLPHPDEIATGGGGLGHRLLLVLAAVQVVAGVVLLVSPLFVDLNPDGPERGAVLLTTIAGLGFLAVGVVLGVLVANARLSDRFRAEEYRGRLQAAGVGRDERPAFLPPDLGGASRGEDETSRGADERSPNGGPEDAARGAGSGAEDHPESSPD